MPRKSKGGYTSAGSIKGAGKKGGRQRGNAAPPADREVRPKYKPSTPESRARNKPKGLHGVPGSKNDSRRCTATARKTGERCKRAAIKGGTVCTTHGGNLPQVKASAKERLLALVDPALAALDKVLRDPNSDDAHRVRAALGILDRTGFRPGMDVNVHGPTPWDNLLGDASAEVDRSTLMPADDPAALGGGDDKHSWEDVDTISREANRRAWDEYDAEDTPAQFDRYGPSVVQGEVVKGSIFPEPTPPPDPDRSAPPRYARDDDEG